VTQSTHFPQAAARSPVLWGGTAAAGFYGLIHSGVIDHALVTRYCASHPVEYITTTMFFGDPQHRGPGAADENGRAAIGAHSRRRTAA